MTLEKKLNKIYASLIAIMFIAIAISSVFAVRTITNTGDNIDTFIRNSKGNYWTATGANLKLAIKDCANASNTVWLPSGTITGCNDVYLWSNVSLVGAGMYNTILKADGACTYGVIYIPNNHDNFSISDLTIDGNKDAIVGMNGIYARGPEDFKFENIIIKNSEGNGLYVTATVGTGGGVSSRGVISNIYAIHCGSASTEPIGFNNLTDCQISNIHVESSPPVYVIDFHGLRNCTVDGVYAKGTGGIKIYGEGSWYVSNCTFNNIVIEDCNATPDPDLWVYLTKNTDISNVVVSEGNAGVNIQSSSWVNINNFNIELSATYGLKIYASNNINVNNIDNYYPGAVALHIENSHNVTVLEYNGVGGTNGHIDSCKDFRVGYSKFAAGSSFGLGIDDCTRFTISHCEFYKMGAAAIDTVSYTASNNYTLDFNFFQITTSLNAVAINTADNYFIADGNICVGGTTGGFDWNTPATATRCCNATYGGFNIGTNKWS